MSSLSFVQFCRCLVVLEPFAVTKAEVSQSIDSTPSARCNYTDVCSIRSEFRGGKRLQRRLHGAATVTATVRLGAARTLKTDSEGCRQLPQSLTPVRRPPSVLHVTSPYPRCSIQRACTVETRQLHTNSSDRSLKAIIILIIVIVIINSK